MEVQCELVQQEGVWVGFLAQEGAVVQKDQVKRNIRGRGSGSVTLSECGRDHQVQVLLRQGQFGGLVREQAVQADGAVDKEDSTGIILLTAQTWAGTGLGSDLVGQQQSRNVEALDYHVA